MSDAKHHGPRGRTGLDEPPPRPATEADLTFQRRPSVRWFSPAVLASAGLRVVLSAVFGAFLDKRELQAVHEAPPLTQLVEGRELWLDYLSDTGDGFDATYTLAWLASRPNLPVAGLDEPLPRGNALVLGGDEVYPSAEPIEYEDRFVGPFSAALPWLPPDETPDVFVLAGNHDWYDGLTAFIRTFCQKKWMGARRTSQSRSYFAVALPHRWWLWGIDIQLDSYIDEPQLRYFERAAEDMQPGDRVILCTAKPSWVETSEEPDAYRNLAYLERALIRPAEARLVLTLTGDQHHYARYEGTGEMKGTHKVTAGGGGAFLHPTHSLPAELALEVDRRDASPQRYARRTCYPDMSRSRRMSWGALVLPFRNPTFMLIPGVAHVLLVWAGQFSIRTLGAEDGGPLAATAEDFGVEDLLVGVVGGPVSLVLLFLVWAGLVGFAKPPTRWRGRARTAAKLVMGSAHGLIQLAALLAVAWVWIRIASLLGDTWFTVVVMMALVAVLGGLAGGLAMGFYLAICNGVPGLDTHGNEAFSAQRLTSYKSFLRIHIDADGVLRLYPIGVERANERWRLDPDAGPSAPWLAPEGRPPRAHLIEDPIVIDGR
jgi:hypothetical protein